MKKRDHCTPGVCPGATAMGEIVSIYVDHNHPLLQLKRALPWATLFEVMTRRWAAAGKNTDGRPGLPWDVSRPRSWDRPLGLDEPPENQRLDTDKG